MKRVLRSELYRLCCDWWMFVLFAALVAAFCLVLGAEVGNGAALGQGAQYAETALYRMLSNGAAVLIFGLLTSLYFFAVDSRAHGGAIYAGVGRACQTFARLAIVLALSVALSLAAALLAMFRFSPGWLALLPPSRALRALGKSALAAAASVSLQALAVFAAREFFRAACAGAAATFVGLFLVKESGSPVKSAFCRAMFWHPSAVQRQAEYWVGDGSAVARSVCCLALIVVACSALMYAFCRRRELR